MPTWGEVLKEVQKSAQENAPRGPDLDGIRLKYLKAISNISGHAVISYASGWMEPGKESLAFSVDGSDVHGLMEVCYKVEEHKLDLILHSPGGSPQAAEQMIEYLRTRFEYIRAIVPLQAKSAATMMALGRDEIVLGAHSELGPIDPQILVPVPEGRRFAPAHAILRDFKRAKEECGDDVKSLPAWTPILRSYAGGLIEYCHQQVLLSMEVVGTWLAKYMLSHPDLEVSEADRPRKARELAEWFGSEASYDRFRTHGRPLRYPELKAIGLRVNTLEADERLQDAVLSLFHATQITLNGPPVKIIENHLGRRKVNIEHHVIVQTPQQKNLPGTAPPNREKRRRSG